jgi:hypothetical protein
MDQADSQRGSPPILFDQPSHGSQDDSSHLPWSNKISSQINTDILGQYDFVNDQVGSHASIDNALQINGFFTPPQSNCIGHFSNNLQLQQSLNAAASADCRHTSNDQETFLTFLNDGLRINELTTLSPPRQPSYLEDSLGHTLSEQSANAAAFSQGSYPVYNQHSSITDHGNAFLGFVDVVQLQTTLTDLDNTVQPSSTYPNYLGNFPSHTLEQSASVAANSQCSYPASDPQTTLTGFDNTFQPSPSFDSTRPGNLPSHTLFAELNDATAYSQILYPANNPQATLADLGNVHQTSPRSQSSCHEAWENNTLAECVGHSSIIIPLSLALTEHQDPAQNFEQYPLSWLLQPNIEHQLGSPSAGMALVNQSLALNRRQNPCIGCRLRKIKVFSLTLQ